MIILSDRLQLMADLINEGETMADIGTDHGFLPTYLLENNISPRVIMADVSSGALDKAKENFQAFLDENGDEFKERADIRLGNGLAVLENSEVDVVAIAGMGGRLMTELLGADFKKTLSIKRFILQPRNGLGELRHWLKARNFEITKELLVDEDGNICTIMVVIPPNILSEDIDSIKDPFYGNPLWFKHFEPEASEEWPETVIRDNRQLGIKLFNENIEKLNRISKEIESKADAENRDRLELIKSWLIYLEEMVGKYA